MMFLTSIITLFFYLALVGGEGSIEDAIFSEESFGLHPNGKVNGHASSGATSSSELSPHLFLSSKTPYYSGALGAAEPIPSQCKLVHINHLGESLFCPPPLYPPFF